MLLVFPGGLGQLLYNLRDRVLIRIADRRDILVPSLVADKRDTSKGAENEVGLLQGALSAPATPTPPPTDDDDAAELEPAGAR